MRRRLRTPTKKATSI